MSTTTVNPKSPSFIVGIGASAGGLDALERFFDNLPRDTGMAFVVVQHLSPDFKSLMDELLARHTELPIHLVEDGMPVEADHVYLIPPKKEMIISGGRLLLSERDRAAGADAADRRLLPLAGAGLRARAPSRSCSRAAAATARAASATSTRRAGWCIVQDVESAQFDGMPRTARDAGRRRLRAAARGDAASARWSTPDARSASPPARRRHGRGGRRASSAVYRMLQEEFGIDFTHYKPSTVTRRIERRLRARARRTNIEEYVAAPAAASATSSTCSTATC